MNDDLKPWEVYVTLFLVSLLIGIVVLGFMSMGEMPV
ncbi:hypothetical protein FHS21_001305 [Phyllobacterium trifolii]|uniref:Uncharacterized protein n=1 Tax=Phyllobacterium trifolii TaxID=300193 RepID=A0A839U4C9_9HYPH|nr:hypothetical protein [Phyllobacterium trifolii]